VTVHDSAEALIRSSDLVVFATVTARPHIENPAWFDHHPLVLNVSLRDLARASCSTRSTSWMTSSTA
jgi:hypothetical protein